MRMKVGEDKLFTLFFAYNQIVTAEDEHDLIFMKEKRKKENYRKNKRWGSRLNNEHAKMGNQTSGGDL